MHCHLIAAVVSAGSASLVVSSVCTGQLVHFELIPVGISSDAAPFTGAAAGDLDGDGDIDVVANTGNRIWMFISSGGAMPTFQRVELAVEPEQPSSVVIADLDRDGDLDVAASCVKIGSQSMAVWYENLGGAPLIFSRHPINVAGQSVHVIVADLNRDGRPDLVSAAAQGSASAMWHENTGSTPLSFVSHAIGPPRNHHSVATADLDRDGDPDIVLCGASPGDSSWFRNSNDGQTLTEEITPIGNLTAVHHVLVADFDLDGDLDVVAGSPIIGPSQVVLFRSDGASNPIFAPAETIGIDSSETLAQADIDCDGAVDVISAAIQDNKIIVYRNDQNGPPIFTRVVAASVTKPNFVSASDLNLDGLPDILVTANNDDTVYWLRQIHCSADLNGDRVVNGGDISFVLNAWGLCP